MVDPLETVSKERGPDIRGSLQIYDPRKGQDFRFGRSAHGRVLSSQAAGFIVVGVPPRVELLSSPHSLVASAALAHFDQTEGVGFVSLFAGPLKMEKVLPGERCAGKDGVFAQSPANPSLFQRYTELLHGLEYGEITFGIANRPRDVAIEVHPHQDIDLLFAVYEIPDLEWCLSFYADTGDGLVMARVGPAADRFLAALDPGACVPS